MRSILFVLLCSLALTQPARADSFFTSDDYWNGKKAYDKGDYVAAMGHWKASAEQGVGEAQYFVGALYHAGQGVDKNYKSAMEWYLKAAHQDVEIAQMGVGGMFADGHGVEKDYIRARMWFSLAEINGSERATRYIERLDSRMSAEDIATSKQMAVDWFNEHRVRK